MQAFLDAGTWFQVLAVYLGIGVILGCLRADGPLTLCIDIIREIVRLGWRGTADGDDAPRAWYQRPPVNSLIALSFIPLVFAVYSVGWPVFEGEELRHRWRYRPEIPEPPKRPELPSHVLTFSHIGGTGRMMCRDCRWQGDVVGALHGFGAPYWRLTGVQCPDCGTFAAVDETAEDPAPDSAWLCPDCSARMTRDEPLFCPHCRSDDLQYRMRLIT